MIITIIVNGAMWKEDHALWQQHDLASDKRSLKPHEVRRMEFEAKVTHVFAENAPAGLRNGTMASRLARETNRTLLRVASRDTTAAASNQSCEMYGQLRRVVHLVEGAPVMLITNLRTPAGLVNGATGLVVGAVLKNSLPDRELRSAISAASVAYVVVDIPKYTGPVVYRDHPTWVPIAPVPNRHKRKKDWERLQLPLVLAWGVTIHKSQGLTFEEGAVVDFAHHPNTKPVATMGLAFVAMTRTREWSKQGFRDLPDFWEFRKVLKDDLFKWRAELEKKMDDAHDRTMTGALGTPFTLELDIQKHCEWSQKKKGKKLSDEELADIREMLQVRGVRPPPV